MITLTSRLQPQVSGISVDKHGRKLTTGSKSFEQAENMDTLARCGFFSISIALISCTLLMWGEPLRADFIDVDTNELPEFDCVIEPSEIVDIGSAVPGIIKAIYARRSDPVKKGAIVAVLESSVEYATVALSKVRAEATTSIRLRQESAEFGARTKQRNQTLFQQSSISKEDIDRLETENRIANLQVMKEKDNKSIAELEYDRARAVLEKHTIRSPVEGVVMERFKTVGEYVEDKPVLRIAQLDPLNVEVILPVEFLGILQPGRKARVTPILPGYIGYMATVDLVDKVADAASGTFGTRLTLPNPNNELPGGLRCKITFLPPEEIPIFVEIELELQDEIDITPDPDPFFIMPELADRGPVIPDYLRMELDESVEDIGANGVDELPLSSISSETMHTESGEFDRLLANEVDDVMVVDDVAQVEQENGSPESKIAAMLITGSGECYKVGPLGNELLAAQLSSRLGMESSTAVASHSKIRFYQILIADQHSESATRQLVKELQSAGIDDMYVHKGGEVKGRISLGVYSNEKRALARLSRLDAMGIDVEVTELFREKTAYWLKLSLTHHPEAEIELQTAASNIAPSASVERTSCGQTGDQANGILGSESWTIPWACSECTFSDYRTDCEVKQFFSQMNRSFLQSMNGSL